MKYSDIPEGEWDTLWKYMDADELPQVCYIHKRAIAKYPTLSTYLMSLGVGLGIRSSGVARCYLSSVLSTVGLRQLFVFWGISRICQHPVGRFTKSEISFIIDLLKQEDLRLHRSRPLHV